MPLVRTDGLAISLDGFSAGPEQSLENPLGVRGPELFEWFFASKVWREMHGHEGGEEGVDNDIARQSFENVGAFILGRNMFGPIRGSWSDESWRGWWGENPPYHTPVFVLTHHARAPLEMEGGTTFHFVTEGIEAALERSREAAGDRDVRIGGGVSTVRQFLQARLLDRLHLAWRPILLGRGENLFAGLDLSELGYTVEKTVPGERANHVFIVKSLLP